MIEQIRINGVVWLWVTGIGLALSSPLAVVGCVSSLEEDFKQSKGFTKQPDSELNAENLEGDASAPNGDASALEDEKCPDGTYGSSCTPLRTCAPGTYVAREGTKQVDVDCAGCPSGTFSEEENAARCQEWTECEVGEYVARAGSARTDQVCEPCPDGQLSSVTNAGACFKEGTCPNGSVEVTAADADDAPQCEECAPGSFCAGGSSGASACAEGTWDHDADAATPCVERTTCVVGEFVVQAGDALTDRTCENCTAGTFVLGVNEDECRAFTPCEPGTFVAVPGDTTRDRVCSACVGGTYTSKANQSSCQPWTECDPGERVVEEGTTTSDQQCEPCEEDSPNPNEDSCTLESTCPAGTEQTSPTTDESPPDCEPCAAGQYCPGGDRPAADCAAGRWDHDTDPATPCVERTVCLAGAYVADEGDALNDRECDDCASGTFSTGTNAQECQSFSECEPGTYLAAEGSASSDVECSGCPAGSYTSSSNASACAQWIDCQPGQFVAEAGSDSEDRTCRECPDGMDSGGINAGGCVAEGTCQQGTVQVSPATEEAPPECEPCAPGTYCAGSDAEAIPCAAGTWDDDSDPATPCISKTTCAAGQFVFMEGSSTTDRTCVSCLPGRFTDVPNADSCDGWRDCEPGTYVESPGTRAADRACEECGDGTFSDESNASSCGSWSTCSAPSFRQSVAPSPSNDRECEPCAPPAQTVEDNEASCSQVEFQMADGEVVIEVEHYDQRATNGSNDNWIEASDASASNGAVMVVGPDTGDQWDVTATSPRLDYFVNFTTAGMFYVHIRGMGGVPEYEADSCWAGIDGVPIASSFVDFTSSWSWLSQPVNVSSTGTKVVNLWAREDGFRADRIVINQSASAPTGTGPEESARE